MRVGVVSGRLIDGCEDWGLNSCGVLMDSQVWSRLPEHLMPRILECLPIHKMVEFRSVCRRWRSLIASLSFRQAHDSVEDHSIPNFLVCFPIISKWAVYNVSSRKWFPAFLPSGQDKLSLRISADGGLLCTVTWRLGFVDAEHEFLKLQLYNPSTGCVKELPKPSLVRLQDIILLTLSVDKKSRFKIVVAGSPREGSRADPLVTEMFDSICNCWESAGSLPNEWRESNDQSPYLEHATCAGQFYHLVRPGPSHERILLSFDPENKSWKVIPELVPPSVVHQSEHQQPPGILTERRGSLVLVQLKRSRAKAQGEFTFAIWKPRIYTWKPNMTKKWTKFPVKLPPMTQGFRELFEIDLDGDPAWDERDLVFSGKGEKIFFYSPILKWENKGLVYDLAEDTWAITEPCTYMDHSCQAIPVNFNSEALESYWSQSSTGVPPSVQNGAGNSRNSRNSTSLETN